MINPVKGIFVSFSGFDFRFAIRFFFLKNKINGDASHEQKTLTAPGRAAYLGSNQNQCNHVSNFLAHQINWVSNQ